ncbi:MAG: hypothetical protein AABX16_05490 [Nanoarchaeota archaeon]
MKRGKNKTKKYFIIGVIILIIFSFIYFFSKPYLLLSTPPLCPLPAGCQLEMGTTQDAAETLQCYRESYGDDPLNIATYCLKDICDSFFSFGTGTTYCPLDSTDKSGISHQCKLDYSTELERIICVANKVNARLSKNKESVCRHHSYCIDEILTDLGIDSDLSCGISDNRGHSWTEHNIDSDGDGEDDRKLILDIYSGISYSCPL